MRDPIRLVTRPELLPDHGVTCSPVHITKYLQMLSSVFPRKHKSIAKAKHQLNINGRRTGEDGINNIYKYKHYTNCN